MLNVCLIGVGRIGRVHARNLWENPNTSIRYLVDIDLRAAQKLTKAYGGKALAEVSPALEDPKIHAVFVASPPDTHSNLISSAVKAGKPVFCEKPLDVDIDRANACLREIENMDVPVFLGFNRRFDRNFRAVHDAVQKGEIGEVELVLLTSRDPAPPPIEYLETAPGGIFRESMIHDFDMARWLLGEEPAEVFAMASYLIVPEYRDFGEFDTAMVMLKTTSGKLCHINLSWRAVYGYDQRAEVFGSGGMVRSENVRPTTVERFSGDVTKRDVLLHFFVERYREAYIAEAEHFVDVVQGGQHPLTTVEDGRRALVLANAALQSAQTGEVVKVSY